MGLYGSNQSLHHPDEESGPILWKGIPLQESLKIVDVANRAIRIFGQIK